MTDYKTVSAIPFRYLLSVCFLLSGFVSADMNDFDSVKKNEVWFFFSPHPDDVPLTFGGLMLKGNHPPDTNYTVFYNISAYTYSPDETEDNLGDQSIVNTLGHMRGDIDEDLEALINRVTGLRLREDIGALNTVFNGKQNYVHSVYGELDAPLSDTDTSTGDFTFYNAYDTGSFKRIYDKATHVLANTRARNCRVFLPMALPSITRFAHINHFTLREAVIKAAHDLGNRAKCTIYFGEDQPYIGSNLEDGLEAIATFKERLKLRAIDNRIDVDAKWDLISNHYQSQVDPTFEPAVRLRADMLGGKERLYQWRPRDYASATPHPSCHQRFCQY
ncbi:Uncharacterised protein [BD1-7 clade bacterium]|nr:Uncharacterised protein [BD1-7 clade bacterium]